MTSDRILLTEALNHAPPLSLFFLKCHTKDTKELWIIQRIIHQFILNETHSFFYGYPSELEKYTDDKMLIEFVRLKTRLYISLYEGIREKWDTILTHFSPPDLEFPPGSRWERILQSPGQMISAIILDDSSSDIESSLGYREFVSSRCYHAIINSRTIINSLNKELLYGLTQEEEKEIRKAENQYSKTVKMLNLSNENKLRNLCERILASAYAKDQTENPFNVFMQRRHDLDAFTLKYSHPRNKISGERWVNGEKSIIENNKKKKQL